MRKTLTGLGRVSLVVAGLALALTACGSQSSASGDSIDANRGATVGLAMPTRTQTRWIADGNNMVQQFTQMGYKTNMQYADDNSKTQITQIQDMIAQGDKLLVIGAVDADSLAPVLATAAAKHIPVISYDRLIRDTTNVSYYATFDNARVGTMQGELLVDRLGLATKKGPFTIELFAGAPTDNNATFFFQNAMTVLEPYIKSGKLIVRSGQTTFSQVATNNWDAPTAAARLTKIMNADYGSTRLDAILSPNDGISVALIKVLSDHGYGKGGFAWPVITGQDAQLNSVQAIIANEQAGTIYKDTRELAKVAVQMGNALLTGQKPLVNDTTSYNNGDKVVPTYLLEPIAVTKSNYKELLIAGGYYTAAQLS